MNAIKGEGTIVMNSHSVQLPNMSLSRWVDNLAAIGSQKAKQSCYHDSALPLQGYTAQANALTATGVYKQN